MHEPSANVGHRVPQASQDAETPTGASEIFTHHSFGHVSTEGAGTLYSYERESFGVYRCFFCFFIFL